MIRGVLIPGTPINDFLINKVPLSEPMRIKVSTIEHSVDENWIRLLPAGLPIPRGMFLRRLRHSKTPPDPMCPIRQELLFPLPHHGHVS